MVSIIGKLRAYLGQLPYVQLFWVFQVCKFINLSGKLSFTIGTIKVFCFLNLLLVSTKNRLFIYRICYKPKEVLFISLLNYLPLPVLCEDWEASWTSTLLRCCFNVAISFWAFFNSSFVLRWRLVSVSSCLFVSKSWTCKKKYINPTNTYL